MNRTWQNVPLSSSKTSPRRQWRWTWTLHAVATSSSTTPTWASLPRCRRGLHYLWPIWSQRTLQNTTRCNWMFVFVDDHTCKLMSTYHSLWTTKRMTESRLFEVRINQTATWCSYWSEVQRQKYWLRIKIIVYLKVAKNPISHIAIAFISTESSWRRNNDSSDWQQPQQHTSRQHTHIYQVPFAFLLLLRLSGSTLYCNFSSCTLLSWIPISHVRSSWTKIDSVDSWMIDPT